MCVCILPKWSSIPLLANTIWLHSFLPHCFPRCPGNKRYSRSLIIIMLLPDCRSCLWALSAEWRVKYESYNSYLNEWTSGWWIMCVCVCAYVHYTLYLCVCVCVCICTVMSITSFHRNSTVTDKVYMCVYTIFVYVLWCHGVFYVCNLIMNSLHVSC